MPSFRSSTMQFGQTSAVLASHSELDAVVKPAFLPKGWFILDPSKDMMPQYPEVGGSIISNCLGFVPLFLHSHTVEGDTTVTKAAVTLTSGNALQLEDSADGKTEKWWNERGAAWLEAGESGSDASSRSASLNWDDNDHVANATLGGMVYAKGNEVVTAITGSLASPTFDSAVFNNNSTTVTSKQFTIAYRKSSVVQPVDARTTEGSTRVWAGFVRKVSEGKGDVRHIEEFGDEIEMERVWDLEDAGAVAKQWYTLSYLDEDVIPTPVPKGSFNAYQAVMRNFTPFGALAAAKNPSAHLLALAEEAPADVTRDWVMFTCAVLFVLAAVGVMLSANMRSGWMGVLGRLEQPSFWVLALGALTLGSYCVRGQLNVPADQWGRM